MCRHFLLCVSPVELPTPAGRDAAGPEPGHGREPARRWGAAGPGGYGAVRRRNGLAGLAQSTLHSSCRPGNALFFPTFDFFLTFIDTGRNWLRCDATAVQKNVVGSFCRLKGEYSII